MSSIRRPPITLHRRAMRLLEAFYDECDRADLLEALGALAAFYGVAAPRVAWCRPERIDGGRAWAITILGGTSARPIATIRFVHPNRWRRLESPGQPATPASSRKLWLSSMWHEIGHWARQADEERCAEHFEAAMMREYEG